LVGDRDDPDDRQRSVEQKGPLDLARKRLLRLLLYRYIQLVIAIGSSKDGKL